MEQSRFVGAFKLPEQTTEASYLLSFGSFSLSLDTGDSFVSLISCSIAPFTGI